LLFSYFYKIKIDILKLKKIIMFYIKECCFRLMYLLFMLINILLILFINKEFILLIFSFSILEDFLNLNKNLFETII
jgi:hypothetical protein